MVKFLSLGLNLLGNATRRNSITIEVNSETDMKRRERSSFSFGQHNLKVCGIERVWGVGSFGGEYLRMLGGEEATGYKEVMFKFVNCRAG